MKKIVIISILGLLSFSVFCQTIGRIPGHKAEIKTISISPNQKYIASGGYDRMCLLWDVRTNRLQQKLGQSNNSVISSAFSNDGTILAVGYSSGEIRFWEFKQGLSLKRKFSGHISSIFDLDFNPLKPLVYSCGADYTFYAYNYLTGKKEFVLRNGTGIFKCVDVSPDGKKLVTGDSKGRVNVWDAANGKLNFAIEKSGNSIQDICFSPDGKSVVYGTNDEIKIFDLFSKETYVLPSQKLGQLSKLKITHDGQYLILGYREGNVSIYNLDSKFYVESKIFESKGIGDFELFKDDKYIAIGTLNGEISVLSFEFGDRIRKYEISKMVETRIAGWQMKGRYETTEAYKKRVTEENRREKAIEISNFIIDSLGSSQIDPASAKTEYDADNETFKILYSNETNIYLKVPISEAPSFDQNLDRLVYSEMDFALTESDEFIFRKAKIYNPANQKVYQYESGIDLSFNSDKLNIHFEPLEVDVETSKKERDLNEGVNEISIGPSEVELNIPRTSNVNEDAIAVVIGNKDYLGDVPNVDYAQRDARIMKEYLEKSFGYQPGNILYVENATLSKMLVLLGDEKSPGKIANYVKPGKSDVFFYYSGHGAPDVNSGGSYLVPINADPSNLAVTGYPLETLYKNLAAIDARSIQLVIDACFSGGSSNGMMLIKEASPIIVKVKSPTSFVDNGLLITASQGDEIASWYGEKGHGLLTFFYLKGLQGDADINSDGIVSASEIKKYLADPTTGVPYWARRIHGREQNPQILFKNDFELMKFE